MTTSPQLPCVHCMASSQGEEGTYAISVGGVVPPLRNQRVSYAQCFGTAISRTERHTLGEKFQDWTMYISFILCISTLGAFLVSLHGFLLPVYSTAASLPALHVRSNGKFKMVQFADLHWETGAKKSRRAAACGRAELLAKKRHTDRLQNLAKLRRFRIGGGIGAG